MKNILFLLALCLGLHAYSQQKSYTGAQKFGPDQIREDFRILTTTVKEYHPAPYQYIAADSLERWVAQAAAGITDSLTDNEFQLLVRKFLVHLRCGHTVARPPDAWYTYQRANPTLLVPFEILLLEGKLYVKESWANNALPAGAEIISINNRPAADIVAGMRAIHTRDGFSQAFVDYSIQILFRTYFLFLYGNAPAYDVVYRNTEGKATEVNLQSGPVPAKKSLPEFDSTQFTRTRKTDWADLYMHTGQKLAVMDIDGFGRKKYKKFYKKAFKEIKANNITHLVVDLRHNGGGYFLNGGYLMKYFTTENYAFAFKRPKKKPQKNKHLGMGFFSKLTRRGFALIPDRVDKEGERNYEVRYKPAKKNHYNGVLYVLTNGGSFSMSGYVAANMKHKTNAIMVGQETGGGEEGSNAVLFYNLLLPATQIKVTIPYYHVDHRVAGAVPGSSVIPDVPVNYTLEDLLGHKDKEIEKVLELVNTRP